VCVVWLSLAGLYAQTATIPWSSYGHDSQHTALSTIGAQRLQQIKWSTPVDLTLTGNTGTIYIHYGSPLVTAANTVIVPVRTTTSNNFRVEAHNGSNGALLYTLTTDYSRPYAGWAPPYVPTLSQGTRLYYAGAGGTVYYRDQVDSATGPSGQIVFYGSSIDTNVVISTPITADANGSIFFGFAVTGSTSANLTSGLARIGADGTGSWTSASAAAQDDTSITEVANNCAPAISNDGAQVYFAVSNGSTGYLVSVDSTTLAPIGRTQLIDPETGQAAQVSDDSTASPTVGPDNDVYYGVLETSCCANHDRGWLLHFDSTLKVSKTPGAFGWDDTASVVPANLVPSYNGSSSYLLFTKYNNYVQTGGGGLNKIAVLDPNAQMTDPVTGATVMQEVITILGPTASNLGGVREWCINSGAIDPFAASAIANSEDGNLYRWSFATNTLTQSVTLTSGIGEAYTSTAIGADGTAYAINNAILFAVGQTSNMTVTSSHIGNFALGQNGVYTLTATNSGAGATNGVVTVTEIVPAAFTAQSIGGQGWACTQPAGPCSRSDSLNAGISYQPIALTVAVGSNPPPSVTNVAEVSSDGAPNSVNSTSTDVTGIISSSLSITKTHSVSFTQGQMGSYTVTVSNALGAQPVTGGVTVTEVLPPGLSIHSMAGSGWSCPGGNTCTEPDTLNAGSHYSNLIVTVNVANNAGTSLTNQVNVSTGGWTSPNASDTTTIISPCAITNDGTASVTDVQQAVNEALGSQPAVNDLNQDGVVNTVDVEIVINAVLTMSCWQ
jgi:uncharacterized repeat protein (TIGR01451 family)